MSFDKNDFRGFNEGYVLELYEAWRRDPSSVDASARELFKTWTPAPGPRTLDPARTSDLGTSDPGALDPHKVVGAVNLAQSIRRYGHWAAGRWATPRSSRRRTE